ncbi:GNAT family acetyltransferase [Apiospora arundinis]
MTLQLQDIDAAVDFPALLRCLLAAYESPPQPLTEVIVPMRGLAPAAAQLSLDEGASRLARWHASDPTSHWQKVVDVETGRIAGGATWHIYDADPFAEPDTTEAVWYPDDGSRRFAEQALESMARPRSQVARKPHLYLFNIFTHPDYRRRGVGQKIMDWGMRKADELGLEIFLRRHTARPAAVPSKRLHRAGRDGNGASDGFPGRGVDEDGGKGTTVYVLSYVAASRREVRRG